jgi:hypothetical protein
LNIIWLKTNQNNETRKKAVMEQLNGQKIQVSAEDVSGKMIVARLKRIEFQRYNLMD